jgi:hypothetical protein
VCYLWILNKWGSDHWRHIDNTPHHSLYQRTLPNRHRCVGPVGSQLLDHLWCHHGLTLHGAEIYLLLSEILMVQLHEIYFPHVNIECKIHHIQSFRCTLVCHNAASTCSFHFQTITANFWKGDAAHGKFLS